MCFFPAYSRNAGLLPQQLLMLPSCGTGQHAGCEIEKSSLKWYRILHSCYKPVGRYATRERNISLVIHHHAVINSHCILLLNLTSESYTEVNKGHPKFKVIYLSKGSST